MVVFLVGYPPSLSGGGDGDGRVGGRVSALNVRDGCNSVGWVSFIACGFRNTSNSA